jgi:hypothetical protein
MTQPEKADLTSAWAVVPEQLVCYVRATAGALPVRYGACPGYESSDSLILIGYPPQDPLNHEAVLQSLKTAMQTTRAHRITLLAALSPGPGFDPENWFRDQETAGDEYLSLPIPLEYLPQKVRNITNRARREVSISQGRKLSREQLELVGHYLKHRDLGPGIRHIFRNIEGYVDTCPGALVISAWNAGGKPAGFSIGDYTGLETAFYMFSFRHPESAPPGTADLLLYEMLKEGEKRGQVRMNLGLSVNPGIAFFKKKWQALPFLPYVETSWKRRPGGRLAKLWKRAFSGGSRG